MWYRLLLNLNKHDLTLSVTNYVTNIRTKRYLSVSPLGIFTCSHPNPLSLSYRLFAPTRFPADAAVLSYPCDPAGCRDRDTAHGRTALGRRALSSKSAPRPASVRQPRPPPRGARLPRASHPSSALQRQVGRNRRRVGGRCHWCHGHALTRTSTSTSKRNTSPPFPTRFLPLWPPPLSLSHLLPIRSFAAVSSFSVLAKSSPY
jgi:hypothetical protein